MKVKERCSTHLISSGHPPTEPISALRSTIGSLWSAGCAWPRDRLNPHLDDSELLRRVESGVGLTHETCHARYWTHEACPTPALLRAPLDRMTRLAARCHRSVQRAAGEKPLDSRLRAGSRTACSVCVLRHNAARSRLPGRKCVHGDRPWHSISTTVTRGVCI